MVEEFNNELRQRLAGIQAEGLYRQLRTMNGAQSTKVSLAGRPGAPVVNFSSNDYLGLANHPALKSAAIEAVERYGAGAGASRLICGSLVPHRELEEAIAEFKGIPAAIAFSSGYSAALGTICALVNRQDIVVLDKLVHACIVDAARLSGATLRIYRHNDLNQLEKILRWAAERTVAPGMPRPKVLIVTESVFSMDGDHAPLGPMVALKERYGAWLMVDEAHATGLYGTNGRGLAEQEGLAGQVEVQMGTLGKALGSAGGYICGSQALIDVLVNRARSFIFSTAPTPAAVAAARAGIRISAGTEGARRRMTLWQNVSLFTGKPASAAANQPQLTSPINPIHIGPEERAMKTSAALLERGFFVPAIRYPTVARGSARLRVTLTADHTAGEIKDFLQALN